MITVYNEKNKERYNALFDKATYDLMHWDQLDPPYQPKEYLPIQFEEEEDLEDYVNNNLGKCYIQESETDENGGIKYKYTPAKAYIAGQTYYKPRGIETLEDLFGHIADLAAIDTRYLMLPLDEDLFIINANTRTITVPSAFKNGVTVQGDIVAETLLFAIDRFFDAQDLKECDIYAQWERVKEPGNVYAVPLTGDGGTAQLIDLEREDGKIIFGWPLSQEIAKESGQIKFVIKFIKRVNGNAEGYILSTLPVTMNISTGLNYSIGSSTKDNENDLFAGIITNSKTIIGTPAAKPEFVMNLDNENSYLNDDGVLSLSVRAKTGDNGTISYLWYKSDNPDTMGAYIETDTPEGEDLAVLELSPTEEAPVAPKYYWAKAVNQLGNQKRTTYSETTYVPAAAAPVVAEQPANAILIPVEESNEATAALSVTVKEADDGHTQTSYQWMRAEIEGDPYSPIDGATDVQLEVAEVGYYKIQVTNTLNGTTAIETSDAAKVFNMPAKVEITDLADKDLYLGNYTFNVTLPDNEFSTGLITYEVWMDDGANGILDENGQLKTGDAAGEDEKFCYENDLTEPVINVTPDLIEFARGKKIALLSVNTIAIGDTVHVAYGQSYGYSLTNEQPEFE